MKNIVILGSTGSIGLQTLEVIDANPQDFNVVGLTAFSNQSLLNEQVEQYNPKYGGSVDQKEIEEMVIQEDIDIIVVACLGTDLTNALLRAIKAGKHVAMANKEMIVENGEEIMSAVKKSSAAFIPVDSEQAGIFQCLEGHQNSEIEKIYITCSGGPFYNNPVQDFDTITAEQAAKHPNWSMGKKISIDSSTLMNKALEIIETKYLFDLKLEQIEVLVHPQSIVHALVQFKDGNMLAHFGYPDMKIPISYALYYPHKKSNDLKRLNLADTKLEFYKPNREKFPSIDFAYQALERKGTFAKRLNQANEEAVEKFIKREISFSEIFSYIENETFN